MHKQGARKILACCDEEVLGDVFEEGKVSLEVKRSFYGGELIDIDDILQKILGMESANIVGNNIVEFMMGKGLLNRGSTMSIDGVRHAQIYFIPN